ncbi:MAG: hypothetical protein ACFFD2_20160, partial [Promethearchaeota archaeon]
IERIKNFNSFAPKARIAPIYKNEKVAKILAGSAFIPYFLFIIKNFNRNKAIHILKEMGRTASILFYSINPINLTKKAQFKKIIKEIGKMSGEKHQFLDVIKEKKIIKSCTIKKYNCIYCTSTTKIENVNMSRCYSSLSFHQNYYNIRSFYLGNLKPRLIYLTLIKTAEHDKDYCEYHMEVID